MLSLYEVCEWAKLLAQRYPLSIVQIHDALERLDSIDRTIQAIKWAQENGLSLDHAVEEMWGCCRKQPQRPDWWPRNPYPKSVFPMPEEQYSEIVPDPKLRTSLSGMLGRGFWDIAADAIWEAMIEAIEDGWVVGE